MSRANFTIALSTREVLRVLNSSPRKLWLHRKERSWNLVPLKNKCNNIKVLSISCSLLHHLSVGHREYIGMTLMKCNCVWERVELKNEVFSALGRENEILYSCWKLNVRERRFVASFAKLDDDEYFGSAHFNRAPSALSSPFLVLRLNTSLSHSKCRERKKERARMERAVRPNSDDGLEGWLNFL